MVKNRHDRHVSFAGVIFRHARFLNARHSKIRPFISLYKSAGDIALLMSDMPKSVKSLKNKI